jgi:ubiquitin carboxyl-terminal hydrolase 4/11/15
MSQGEPQTASAADLQESITLDPFMYLTVPLPIAQYREFKLRYISRDPDQPPVKVRLLIGQNAPFQAVKDKLAQLVKVNPSHVSTRL